MMYKFIITKTKNNFYYIQHFFDNKREKNNMKENQKVKFHNCHYNFVDRTLFVNLEVSFKVKQERRVFYSSLLNTFTTRNTGSLAHQCSSNLS